MIEFTQLSFTYPNATQPALRNVNVRIHAGAFVLVVGESGSGKSTLLRCINGLVPNFSGGTISGQVRVAGLNPIHQTPSTMSQHVGFVFQDPEAQFVMDIVEDEIAFALENAAMPRPEMRVRVEEVLDLLDLAPLRHRTLATLSGGERQRVAIASALALRPKILVLDEPTSQLDPKSAEDVLNALTRLNSDLGLTVVISEHRLERVLPFVDLVVHVSADGIRAAPPRNIMPTLALAPPLIQIAKALNWQPLPMTIKEGRTFAKEYGRRMTDDMPPTQTPTLLQLANLFVQYGNTAVLHGVSLRVNAGEIVALLGRNGSGKSTLLKSVVGLIKPKSGEVFVHGSLANGKSTADICKQVGYLPQDPNALLFADSVQQELEMTLRNHRSLPQPAQVATLLAQLNLAHKAQTYPRDLSTGERQRVAFGAIAITQPKLLLLDEPTRGLDYNAKRQLVALLKLWQRNGAGILLVTHDVELTAELATRVVVLSQGEIISQGNPRQVLAQSPLFAPQMARLFPETGWLTVADVLAGGV